MSAVVRLTGRHMRLYFRDKTAVFFSLLAVLIVIALYALFLGQSVRSSVAADVGDIEGVGWLVDSWIMAGILSVASVSVTLGVLGTLVTDRIEGQMDGFMVAPVSRSAITLSYYFSALSVGFLMTLIGLVVAELYIVAGGGELLSLGALLRVIGILFLSTLSASTLTLLLTTFIHSNNGYGAVSTIAGTLIGFLTGIYVPMGVMPEAVQTVMKCIPATHGAALLRQTFMEEPLKQVFNGAPESFRAEYEAFNGVVLKAGDKAIPVWAMILVLIGSAAVFAGLSILILRRKKKGS